jgi:MYND finger
MAPPTFPNGMTLSNIGFAALKYPALPPAPINVPLGNMVGALQYASPSAQNHMRAQIASQFLNALIEYQTSDEPTLHDPTLPQYYTSTAIVLMNFLTSTSDVCKQIAKHPALINDIIEKLLAPDFVDRMKAVTRPSGPMGIPPATFDDDFGTLLQFVSTMLLYRAEIESLHPRINELIPKLREWNRTFENSPARTIKHASERMVDQIQGMDPTMIAIMRRMQETTLVCGVANCRVRGLEGLTVCNGCKIQRYCGREHQKADWKYHKHICNKGLVEPADD